MRFLSGLLTMLAVVALGLGGLALAAKQIFEGEGPLTESRVVEVRKDSHLGAIADRLEQDGVISSSFLFKLAAKVQGVEGRLQAGDYDVPAGASMREVLSMVTTGQAIDYRITVIEGSTVAEVIALINGNDVLVGEIDNTPAEGMIAPETYFVRRGEKRQDVLDRMVAAQKKNLAELWEQRKPGLPIETPEQALILASIVEKETAVAREYPVVASVFVNRLEQGERLDADATVIYGIIQRDGSFSGNITSKDLKDKSNLWSTRVHRGLPPTPISNPGYGAIKGVLQPAETDYLFFVADGTGGHVFAVTSREHQANVRKWLKIERERRESGQ